MFFLGCMLDRERQRHIGLVIKAFSKRGRPAKAKNRMKIYREMKAEYEACGDMEAVIAAFAARRLGRRSTLYKIWSDGQFWDEVIAPIIAKIKMSKK